MTKNCFSEKNLFSSHTEIDKWNQSSNEMYLSLCYPKTSNFWKHLSYLKCKDSSREERQSRQAMNHATNTQNCDSNLKEKLAKVDFQDGFFHITSLNETRVYTNRAFSKKLIILRKRLSTNNLPLVLPEKKLWTVLEKNNSVFDSKLYQPTGLNDWLQV